MITLTLLHPIQSTPVQSWNFEHETVIRIGRSTDNHVILYSAVVSRHHVELRQINSQWEIVNLGANGTYLNGKQITQVPVVDGVIIRLARSGPNIQIHVGELPASPAGESSLAQRLRPKSSLSNTAAKESNGAMNPVAPLPVTSSSQANLDQAFSPVVISVPIAEQEIELSEAHAPILETSSVTGSNLVECLHPKATPDTLFCPDCGQPLRTLQTIGSYHLLKTLSKDAIGVTQLVWRENQSLLLRTLNTHWMRQPEASDLFAQQAARLLQLHHPGIPRFIDFFVEAGYPYLVMEQIYGQDLHQRVENLGPLPQAEAIEVILQVCDVLDYLHQQSPPFVHQDLKPANLIQRTPPFPADLGIVLTGFVSLTLLKIETQPTLSGYVAPEQQQGGSATPASDLFALGPTLVYLLTGKPPNQFYAQREQGFRFYPEYVPGLTSEMAAVIRRLTNPNPEERYATPTEVKTALNQLSV